MSWLCSFFPFVHDWSIWTLVGENMQIRRCCNCGWHECKPIIIKEVLDE